MAKDLAPIAATRPRQQERSHASSPVPSAGVDFAEVLQAQQDAPSNYPSEPLLPSGTRGIVTPEERISRASVTKGYWLPGFFAKPNQTSSQSFSSDSLRTVTIARTLPSSSTVDVSPSAPVARSVPAVTKPNPGGPLSLEAYPRPLEDNGWGMHWIPTVSSSPEVVDRFVAELKDMGVKWVTFLNEGTNIGANDYLVKRLVESGMMPIMRVYTPGLVPIEGDLGAMVRHYRNLGVSYFQIYNEPNLALENGGRPPSVDRYLDLWIPAAKQVLAGGGLPGFGALSPSGDVDDRAFLSAALERLAERGEEDILNRAWLSMHNYAGPRPLEDPDGFLRFRQYAEIMRSHLGRVIPIIGTEAGTYVGPSCSEERQAELVTGAYQYMAERCEPYCLAYSYWVVANKEGGGHDSNWEEHALFGEGGQISRIVTSLKSLAERITR